MAGHRAAVNAEARVRLTAYVKGQVQGVGFRAWTRELAARLRLAGTVENLPDGRVRVVAEGPRSACHALLIALRGRGTPGRVVGVTAEWEPARGLVDFSVS